MFGWISQALRDSHLDKKREHAEAVARLRAEYDRLERRIDRMYDDKLDGKITDEYFAKRSAEARTDQTRIQRDLEKHQHASEAYVEDGIRILELAKGAYEQFIQQSPGEKRRLLQYLVSNCTWKDGTLEVEYGQPFDTLAVAAERHREQKAAGTLSSDLSVNWRP